MLTRITKYVIALSLITLASVAHAQPKWNVAPRLPTGVDTHTLDATSYSYVYAKGSSIDDGADTDDLDLRVYKPAGIAASQPLPAVVWIGTGSFTNSSAADGAGAQARAEFFTQCGMIHVLVRTRVNPDAPTEPDGAANGAVNQLGRSINAIIWDTYRALKFIQSNPDPDSWRVEPNWVFLGGGSSGGTAALCAAIRHANDIQVPGVIVSSTAFGGDNTILGLNYTDEVRTDLGFTEAGLSASPPVCLFTRQDDDTLSTPPNDWQGDLQAVVEGLGGDNITHVDAVGSGHISLGEWGALSGVFTGASSLEEAIYDFVSARCTATARLSGTAQLD